MTDKNSNSSRRKLLKSIAAGSGAVVTGKSLPESWSKPVVEGILLPAHASTTIASATIASTTIECDPKYEFVEGGPPSAIWNCRSGGSYTLLCRVAPPDDGANVQVEVSGTGVCESMKGPHDKTSATTSSFDTFTQYKWSKFGTECEKPTDFTAVFSIVDSCEEPLVAQGEITDDDCDDD